MTPFLAIHAKGGESISPKQKDHTTTFRIFLIDTFKIDMFIFNWLVFSKIDKIKFFKTHRFMFQNRGIRPRLIYFQKKKIIIIFSK